MTTVAVVDDHPTIRETFCNWINAEKGLHCVCACANAQEALKEIPKHHPQVVLMDINMPGESGIACTAQLKAQLPRLQIIMVTVYRDLDSIFRALQAGASGYLLKRCHADELIQSIRDVCSGGAPMTSEIARMIVESFQQKSGNASEHETLTKREAEILELLSQGLSNKEIGAHLNISYDTVRNHLRHIYEKLHVRGRTDAVRIYFQSSKPSSPPSDRT